VTTEDVAEDTLAGAIVQLRKRIGTQKKLAELVGVTERTIMRWEAGEAAPQGEHRKALTDLGIDRRLFRRADLPAIGQRLRALEAEVARLRAMYDEEI